MEGTEANSSSANESLRADSNPKNKTNNSSNKLNNCFQHYNCNTKRNNSNNTNTNGNSSNSSSKDDSNVRIDDEQVKEGEEDEDDIVLDDLPDDEGSDESDEEDQVIRDDDQLIDQEEDEEQFGNGNLKGRKLVWRSDERPLESDEELQLSPGCYDMLHRLSLDWSCLSFDVLRDELGACRLEFPLECLVVSGTQPAGVGLVDSSVHVMRWANLTQNFGCFDELLEGEEECRFLVASFPHRGVVNRVKGCPQASRLVCTMADTRLAHVWDIHSEIQHLQRGVEKSADDSKKPLATCDLHESEGYALSWSPLVTGRLATGSCDGSLVLWEPVEGGWDQRRIVKLDTSIEDLKWSLEDPNLLLAACCDGTLKTSLEARVSSSDLNSLALNPIDRDLALVGCEDGSVLIHSLRRLEAHLASLRWHRRAVTSVDWHPTDSAVCLASCRDDSLSIWDASLEAEGPSESELPQQLLFLHMGQEEITEAIFHRNMPGVVISTALDGFNIFKTVNL